MALRLGACLLCGLVAMVSTAHADRLGAIQPRLAVEPVQPPASWQTRRDYSRFPVSRAIALPPMTKAEMDDRLEPGKPGAPFQIGFPRELPQAQRGDLARTVQWIALPGGGRVASFSLRSPEAGSVRLAVQAKLPDGASVRFFEVGRSDRRYPVFKRGDFIRKGQPASAVSVSPPTGLRTRWSPSIPGDVVGVEIEIPPSADPSEVSFQIVRVSHIHRSPSEISRPGSFVRKNAATCDPVEAVCKTLPDCPNSAVAKITFTLDDGDSYVCTGTAVNSTRSNFDNFDTPYLLTAHHCISSEEAAATVQTRWHYEFSSCGGTDLNQSNATLYQGAELVTSDADSDGSLLRLRDGLPNGVCLAGWDATGGWPNATEVFSLHHPEGQVKEWAGGSIERTRTVGLGDNVVDTINVVWTEGATLGGSSGAGLFTADSGGDDVLIGVLSGGPPDDCTRDAYGQFDRFFGNQAGVHLEPTNPPPADDHGGTAEEATRVLIGSETAGRIDDGSDADVFRVDVVEPGMLTVYTTGLLDTFGRLKREDGSTIDFDDDGGLGLNFSIEAEVTAGTYYVKVTGYDHTEVGGYRLHVDFLPTSASNSVLIPLFLSVSAYDRDGRQSFIRVFNRSDRSGEVRITATDDSGERPGPVTLSIGVFETKPFNSKDLEEGNSQKGLSQGIGPGNGDWRLEFESKLDIEVAAYVRTEDGFLTAMHDLVIVEEHTGAHHVPAFNPARNDEQQSLLRLINPDPDDAVQVKITGYDDEGDKGQSPVELRLLPGTARTLDAPQLENGDDNLTGKFGEGKGKWRLFIETAGRIHVVSLLDSVTGNLTDLSSPGGNNYSQ